LIYDHIKRVYKEKEVATTNHSSLHNSESVKKVERPNTAQKCDKPETGNQYYYRNSSNNSKNEKPKTTETKTSSYVLTGKTNTSTSYY
jgi:hypothetical protein